MVYIRRTRKRVHAIPRAPDGSAFQKCNKCGVSVPILLAEMHECEPNKEVKRFKGVAFDVGKQSFGDQLIVMAPFHFFMKEFAKTSKAGNWVEINREGFEVWKNMSQQERKPYVKEAEKVDEAYHKALLKELDYGVKVDDEADSANTTGNTQKFVEFNGDSSNESSDCLGESWDKSVGSTSWHTYHRPMVHEFTS